MKSMIVGLLCLAPSAALARVDLPVSTSYCDPSIAISRQGLNGYGKFACIAETIAEDGIQLTCMKKDGSVFPLAIDKLVEKDGTLVVTWRGETAVFRPCEWWQNGGGE